MAYSPDAVDAKLSTLNETQDSIVSVAQWLLFHRRHADRTAQIWLEKLKASTPPKRLNLIYLVNEVVQQSRARGKQDFLLAFEPIVAEGTASAYKGANDSQQGKIRRVVEVWRARTVFEGRILDAVEGRLAELDRSKGTKSSGKLGGSLFGGGGSGGGVPAELEAASRSLAAVTKAEVTKAPSVETAEREFEKMTDPSATLPTPPVLAARLSALMKNLGSAQAALEACVKARRELVQGLEKLLATHRAKLAEEEASVSTLMAKREGIEVKKREVEDGIMRGLSSPSSPVTTTPQSASPLPQANGNGDAQAPEAETFTPPPPEIETFTPELKPDAAPDTSNLASLEDTDSFAPNPSSTNPTGADLDVNSTFLPQPPSHDEPPPTRAVTGAPSLPAAIAALDPRIRQASSEVPASGDPRLKRRKVSHATNTGGDVDAVLLGGGGNGIAGGDGGEGIDLGVDEEGVSALL